jgi:hypothetical protein
LRRAAIGKLFLVRMKLTVLDEAFDRNDKTT